MYYLAAGDVVLHVTGCEKRNHIVHFQIFILKYLEPYIAAADFRKLWHNYSSIILLLLLAILNSDHFLDKRRVNHVCKLPFMPHFGGSPLQTGDLIPVASKECLLVSILYVAMTF